MCLLQRGLSNAIKISYRWWNKSEKNIQACVNQEIRNDKNCHLFAVASLVIQKNYNSNNCIVLMIINIFIVSMIIGGPASGVANPKLWVFKMFDFRPVVPKLFYMGAQSQG